MEAGDKQEYDSSFPSNIIINSLCSFPSCFLIVLHDFLTISTRPITEGLIELEETDVSFSVNCWFKTSISSINEDICL